MLEKKKKRKQSYNVKKVTEVRVKKKQSRGNEKEMKNSSLKYYTREFLSLPLISSHSVYTKMKPIKTK